MFLRTELTEDVQNLQNETHRQLWLVASLEGRINAKLELARGEQGEERRRRLQAECEELARIKISALRQLEETVRLTVEELSEEIDSIKFETAQKSTSSKVFQDAKESTAATKKLKKKQRAEVGRGFAAPPVLLKTVYCPCGVDLGEEEIGCDNCERWFHPSCVDFPKGNVDAKADWFCEQCREELRA